MWISIMKPISADKQYWLQRLSDENENKKTKEAEKSFKYVRSEKSGVERSY